MKKMITICMIAAVLVTAQTASAMLMDTVTIGDLGNAADTDTGRGAVGYNYYIGTYAVTSAQYTGFLTAVAATDTYGLYNTGMAGPGESGSGSVGITRTGSSGSYSYSTVTGRENIPVQYVSWGDAARFANWMHNNQPTGSQDLTTTEDGAYYLNGATSNAALVTVNREADWLWAVPSENEWYKAAYYDGSVYYDYATGTNTMPAAGSPPGGANSANYNAGTVIGVQDVGAYTGSGSPYGTFDQSGNVFELNERLFDLGAGVWAAGLRGGSFGLTGDYMDKYGAGLYGIDRAWEGAGTGFRVVAVPVPGAVLLGILGLSVAGIKLRKFA